MPKYEAHGVIKHLFDPQTFASGFTKREFVIETENGKYPQLIKFEAIKDKVEQLSQLRVGDAVNVSFDIRGSEYKERFYVQLNAWKIEADGDYQPPRDRTPQDGYRQGSQAHHQQQKQNGYQPQDNSANDMDGDEIPFRKLTNITHY